MGKIKVGILGATGMVGQRLVQLLDSHPWFEVSELAASPKSVGRSYADAVSGRWKISDSVPEYAKGMVVKNCSPGLDCSIVFSALDSSVAGDIEAGFAKAGYVVSSNSRNHRMERDVPLLIPEVNPGHLQLIETQRKNRGWGGFIVTNPNCSTIHMALALKPLHDAFNLRKVMVTTMQAISGAGYAGFSLDIDDNILPYIGGEEEKIESEALKVLGSYSDGRVTAASVAVSASCNRVNVIDGHTESVSVGFEKKPSQEEVVEAFNSFNPLKGLNLPSSPSQPVVVMSELDRPQPRHDRMVNNGMSSVVGRVRPCDVLDCKFTVLGHNTIRGAAGAAILNAELMKANGYLGGVE